MPERNAGREAGTEEDSSVQALRSKDTESPAAEKASGATQRAQTPQVMAEIKEEAQLWSGTVLQDASVSKLNHLVPGWSRVKLTFLSYHRIGPNSPPGLQAD